MAIAQRTVWIGFGASLPGVTHSTIIRATHLLLIAERSNARKAIRIQ